MAGLSPSGADRNPVVFGDSRVTRITAARGARLLAVLVVGFGIIWSSYRYGADLPAIRDYVKRP